MMQYGRLSLLAALATLSVVLGPAPKTPAQVAATASPPTHVHIIVPQVRHIPERIREAAVRVESIAANITIEGQVASTELQIGLHNPSRRAQEAQILLPVPPGVSIRSLQYDGVGPEPTAKLLPADEARRIYHSIVNSMKDPALLEFAGYNLIRTSVFPVPPGEKQNVRIVYEGLLEADAGRVDYVLPRSESLEAVGPHAPQWTITATIRSDHPIATIYSPSHDLETEKLAPGHMKVNVTAASAREPGAFRLSYLPQRNGGEAGGMLGTFLAFPDAVNDGGYFMLLIAAPENEDRARTMQREVILGIDRSGSMRGPKMDQARAAALQVLEGLEEGEAFNIIDYSDSISSFSKRPVIKNAETMAQARSYLRAMQASGGTALHNALIEAVRSEPTEGMLPLVLFLTDGLPTVGERNEVNIRESVRKENIHNRRIFTFGVGYDVNAPLLTAIARTSRAAGTFVLPEEDVEVKVSQVFRRLEGPVLASPRLEALDAHGQVSTRLIREVQPAELMDIFLGDQVVILGQYRGDGRITLRLTGQHLGKPRTQDFRFDTASASARHGYVPRLWATRKIGALLEEVRVLGAAGAGAATDPRFKELVDEIVHLSTQYGVLTEYTAFLATEPTGPGGEMAGRPAAAPVAGETARRMISEELSEKALRIRASSSAVAQDMNIDHQNRMAKDSALQQYRDADMNTITLTGVQRAHDKAMFNRGPRWVEAALIPQEQEAPHKIVEFGTDEFAQVVDQLARENRQVMLARGGDVYLLLDGQRVLVRCP